MRGSPVYHQSVSRRPWHVAPLVLAMTLGVAAVARAQSPVPTLEATPVPGTVSGTTFGTSGLPLPGVSLWMETELVAGRPGRAVSDADGRYLVTDLSPYNVYSAHARYPVEYAGRSWCLRLAPRDWGDDAVFSGTEGVVRDFDWRLSGPVDGATMPPTEDGAWWGGTVRLFPDFSDGVYDRVIELTFEPTGPLVDGSTGSTVVRTVDLADTVFVFDIPLGTYQVTAATVEPDGGRTPLLVAQSDDPPVASAAFEFEPEDWSGDCAGSSWGTGIARAFLDVVLP